jgi:hypothetical protein
MKKNYCSYNSTGLSVELTISFGPYSENLPRGKFNRFDLAFNELYN